MDEDALRESDGWLMGGRRRVSRGKWVGGDFFLLHGKNLSRLGKKIN